jgi:hypothetical protein
MIYGAEMAKTVSIIPIVRILAPNKILNDKWASTGETNTHFLIPFFFLCLQEGLLFLPFDKFQPGNGI